MRTKDKIDETSLIILTVLSLYLPVMLLNMLEGISWVRPWHFGISYLSFLVLMYFIFRNTFIGIKTFLSLLLFSFMIYPIIVYYLYENNKSNYHVSDNFLIMEALLAKEKINNRISMNDLKEIQTVIREKKLNNPKVVEIPDRIKLEYKNINSSKLEVRMSKETR